MVKMNSQQMIDILNDGGVGILRTDTLYGIVARADDEAAVERIFQTKVRDRDKPLIVLLPSAAAAYDESETISKISENSNTPTTIIVESPHAPAWLRHTDGSVGYRLPKDRTLRKLLEQTGPLVAPSANPQGLEPARTIDQAREYFGESIDCYLDGGEVPASQPPSQIFKIKTDGSIERLR